MGLKDRAQLKAKQKLKRKKMHIKLAKNAFSVKIINTGNNLSNLRKNAEIR